MRLYYVYFRDELVGQTHAQDELDAIYEIARRKGMDGNGFNLDDWMAE